VRAGIATEARGDEHIPPVYAGNSDVPLEVLHITAGQLQNGVANALDQIRVISDKRKIRADTLDEDPFDDGAVGLREQGRDAYPCVAG
jgi:hypothetical protein